MSLYAFDGTTNRNYLGAEELRHTNVLRFTRASADIGLFYERGVGTREGKVGSVLGSAFGAGGFSRINRMYDNVCKVYLAGDRSIDVIGFSRGALLALGLVNKLAEDGIRTASGTIVQQAPPIRFLGLWDAVGSFGLAFGPFQKVNIGHSGGVPIAVQHCFHAMSLDERRDTFTLTRLKKLGAYEVWFRGVHSDVGGGNGNAALGNISLRWMLRKAQLVGVPIREDQIPSDAHIDITAPISDPPDWVKQPPREIEPGDRVHYTVTQRHDGRCNNPGQDCVIETEDDERNLAIAVQNSLRPPTVFPRSPKVSAVEPPPSQSLHTATPSRRPDVWMLSDRPLEQQFGEQDKFQFNDYADALAAILDHEKTATPFTMAVNAPWGAGKTTLANMVAAQLEQRPRDRGEAPHIVCRFNAWMHDDAPNLATAFISEVSRSADRHRHWLIRLLRPLPWAVLEPNVRRRRRGWVGGVLFLLALSVSWWIGAHLQHVEAAEKDEAARSISYQSTETVVRDATGKEASRNVTESSTRTGLIVPPAKEPDGADSIDLLIVWVQSRTIVLGAFFTALAGLIGVTVKVLMSTALGGFIESPQKAAESGAIQAAQRQLKGLLKQATWRGNRFVVFVDDVDRCKPPRSIDVLDAVNQLMDHHGVVVVLLGDMSAVAAAAQLKYKELAEIYVPSAGIALAGGDRGKEAFGRLYLQKIVQFQFDLPIPPRTKIQEYIGQLAITPEAEGTDRGPAAT